jgi:hypothetical protein
MDRGIDRFYVSTEPTLAPELLGIPKVDSLTEPIVFFGTAGEWNVAIYYLLPHGTVTTMVSNH